MKKIIIEIIRYKEEKEEGELRVNKVETYISDGGDELEKNKADDKDAKDSDSDAETE
jgi:hypothetical protein